MTDDSTPHHPPPPVPEPVEGPAHHPPPPPPVPELVEGPPGHPPAPVPELVEGPAHHPPPPVPELVEGPPGHPPAPVPELVEGPAHHPPPPVPELVEGPPAHPPPPVPELVEGPPGHPPPPVPELVEGPDPFSRVLRVLHVWQPTEAGVPRYAWAAAQFQAVHGWRVDVACPNPTPHDGITTHIWDAQRNPVRGLRAESAQLRRILAQVLPQVVVAHSAKAGLVVRTTVRGAIPTVYVPHAWPHLALPRAAQPVAVTWERLAARWTDAVIAVGQGEADEGHRRHISAPISVVRNPVPPGWSAQSAADRHAARADLGLPHGPLAVCVGRFSRQKGQDVLVTAWRDVVAQVPDATLVLVGDGPDLAAVRELAGDLADSRILFPGATDRPQPYLAAADVAVLPSRWEGLSLSMLEAMASARSTVVTEVSGSEVVSDADAGAVVPVDDPAALAAALIPRMAGRVDIEAEGRRGAEWVGRHHDFTTEMLRLARIISNAVPR